MGLSGRLLLGGMAAGVALAYYVRKRHVESGEAYVDIIRRLPSVARRSADDIRSRAILALEDGKAAARARDQEIGKQLRALQAPTTASTTDKGR